MSEIEKLREEYQHALRSTYVSRDVDECGRTYDLVDEAAADALIAALEAELERLRCCGNCCLLYVAYDGQTFCDAPANDDDEESVELRDHCHLTPSRWQRREG